MVIGRSEELAVVSAFIDDVAEGPATLVIAGEPGIGKSTLWSAGIEIALGAEYRVLRAAPAEADAELPYGTMNDLLDPLMPSVEGSSCPPRSVAPWRWRCSRRKRPRRSISVPSRRRSSRR